LLLDSKLPAPLADRISTVRRKAVTVGWPMILASLKSLLETGESLEDPRQSGTGTT
jgi:hypothetical protein